MTLIGMSELIGAHQGEKPMRALAHDHDDEEGDGDWPTSKVICPS